MGMLPNKSSEHAPRIQSVAEKPLPPEHLLVSALQDKDQLF